MHRWQCQEQETPEIAGPGVPNPVIQRGLQKWHADHHAYPDVGRYQAAYVGHSEVQATPLLDRHPEVSMICDLLGRRPARWRSVGGPLEYLAASMPPGFPRRCCGSGRWPGRYEHPGRCAARRGGGDATRWRLQRFEDQTWVGCQAAGC